MTEKPQALLSGLVLRPHHTAVCVENFDAAQGFFCDVIGMTVEGEADHRDEEKLGVVVGLPGAVIRWAMLELSGYRVELFRYYHPDGRTINISQSDRGITHIAFEVTNADTVHARITDAGYQAYSLPHDLRGGATRPFYIHGPEGVVVEFIEIRNG